jgi:RNase P subunit RPR2
VALAWYKLLTIDSKVSMMSTVETSEERCKDCGQPLFLDKKECSDFIERKLRQGYIVCSCCGIQTRK